MPNDIQNTDPRIYTEEEIDLFLKGDRREIDKLLLTACNSMACAFLRFRDGEFRPHAEFEGKVFGALGEPEDIVRRRVWLDLQIDKERDRAQLRKKLLEATLFKIIPVLILGLLAIFQTGLRETIVGWFPRTQQESAQPHAKVTKP